MSKTYAFSDIHGNYALWAQIRDFCKEDDTIYFLGDVADRGPDGIKILQEMMKDKRIHFILGNHDYFILDQFNAVTATELTTCNEQWLLNGGMPTKHDLNLLPQKERIKIFRYLADKTGYYIVYNREDGKQVILCHAGLTVKKNCASDFSVSTYNLLWDRNHIEDKDDIEDNVYIIHGHTPMQTLWKQEQKERDKIEPYVYADGHKIDIDCGTPWSNRILLLDLDTFQATCFCAAPA